MREKQTHYQGDLARLTALGAGALAFFGAVLLATLTVPLRPTFDRTPADQRDLSG